MNRNSCLRLICLMAVAGGSAPDATADYLQIDNFEGHSLGPINGENDWFAQSGTVVSVDPADDANQVLAVSNANTVAYRGLLLPEGQTRMMFLRFRFEDQLNASFGLSHAQRPSEQSDFGPEMKLTASTADLRVENGTATDTVATLATKEWYNLWVHVNNLDDNIQVWLNSGVTDSASADDKLTNTLAEDVFDFRTGSGLDLVNFYIKNGSGGMSEFGPLYFDDIYLESTEVLNLKNPLGLPCDPNNQGDFDGNGVVEFSDFLLLSANFGAEVPNHTFGDFDCNGAVEFADFLGMSANFGKSVADPVAVPEPIGHAIFGLMCLFGLYLRQSRVS